MKKGYKEIEAQEKKWVLIKNVCLASSLLPLTRSYRFDGIWGRGNLILYLSNNRYSEQHSSFG